MAKTKFRDSIDHLKDLGYNVPEVLYTLPGGITDTDKWKYEVLLEAMCKSLSKKHIEVTLRNSELEYPPIAYLPHDLMKFLAAWKYDTELCILKYPRTTAYLHGRCTPGPHFNRYEIFPKGPNFSVPWGTSMDIEGKIVTDIELRKAVDRVNSLLSTHKAALDGYEVEFSLHVGAEGLLKSNEMFWGYRSKDYGY